ncbi:MAG: glycoside hydrolase N-terminal domain-containing protein, partial [Verrucomicrobia bacterium]|nr:glycoside hydrolase N-terminal domain-containing protein [Verrucomicrobiota bacterium]
HVDPYHPAFDIVIDADSAPIFHHYRRRLELDTGEATVCWQVGDAMYARSAFVSCADDVIVIRLTTTGSAAFGINVKLRQHEVAPWDDNWFERGQSADSIPITFAAETTGVTTSVTGTYADGRQFGGIARVEAIGGRTAGAEGGVGVADAQQVLILVKVFANEPAAVALDRCRDDLFSLPADYDDLLDRHTRVHRELFQRASLQLTEEASASNEELLMQASDGDVPTALVQRMFDFGRYLLLSSSRPGGWPANLQGIWNGNYYPAWWSDFHNDENIQMNYWQALPGNMPEVALPFFDFYEASLDDWRENARKIYGCRGVLAGISQSTHGLVFPGNWVNWTAGAGWLAQLFYDYWLFTGDREFLANRAIPFLQEVARFYEDFLFEDADGRYVFAPSLSPENKPAVEKSSAVTINAAMDIAVAKEVLSNLCDACDTLGVEAEGVAKWRGMIARMPAYMINADGALKEWLHPDLLDNYHHRHQSHIYPVFPGFEVNLEDSPELFEAARVAVEKRLVVGLASQTGWSFAHMANIYARLGDGHRALECLELILRACTGPNLFTYHNDWRAQGMSWYWGHTAQVAFQIDANLGFTSAVQEMLVQSRPGFIAVLPALPDAWPTGSIEQLQTRCGVSVSIQWTVGRARLELRSRQDQQLTLRTPYAFVEGSSASLAIIRNWTANGLFYAEVQLSAGQTASVDAGQAAR